MIKEKKLVLDFILVQLFIISNASTELVTDGHVYKYESLQDTESHDDPTNMVLTQEIFGCNLEDSCSQVFNNNISKTNSQPTEAKSSWKKTTTSVVKSNCKELYDEGKRFSGKYLIKPAAKTFLEVPCDLGTENRGWIVIQRRVNNSTNFYRNWSEYRKGFGDLNGNMWIGLDNLHLLAAPGKQAILRVDMKHRLWGKELFYARYDKFEISGEGDGFRLATGGYKGTADDSFNWPSATTINNGMKFSTFDKDQDNGPDNCAVQYSGAWWYNNCHASNLNGLYPPNKNLENPKYISWQGFGDYGNVYFSEMKISYP